MGEIYRLVRQSVIQIDVPDELIEQVKQLNIDKWKARGYCCLRSHVTEWVADIGDKETHPFRWLKLYLIYVGKGKVEDEEHCAKLRREVRGNLYIIPR